VVILLLLACPGTEKESGDTATTAVSYDDQIQFTFDRNCAFSGCHLGAESEEGMDLSPGVSYANIVNVASRQVPSLDRVEPGDPEASYLFLKLNDRADEVGGDETRMPPELFLSAPELEMFEQWITEGANP
jgi:hypothetical protein